MSKEKFINNPIVKKVLLTAAATGLVLTQASCFHYIEGQGQGKIISTPTPSAASGTPSPKETVTVTATPKPSEAAGTPRPSETSKSNEKSAGFTYRHLNPGESDDFGTNAFVMGDGAVNGREIFDHNAKTGLVIDMQAPGRVTAPFGADVRIALNPADKARLIMEAKLEMQKNNPNLTEGVDVLPFTGTSQQPIQGEGRVVFATPTPGSNEKLTSFTHRHLNPGESDDFGTNAFVMGDGAVNGREIFDHNAKTGLVIDMQAPGRVTAPFGADVRIALNPADKARLIMEAKLEMQKNNPNLTEGVDVLPFTGTSQQPIQGEGRVVFATPTPQPIEAPIQDPGMFIRFDQNETKVVFNAVLSGDFRLGGINGIFLHDNRADTGAILIAEGQTVAFSEFGASGNANFRTQAGIETKATEILRQKLTEFREVTVNQTRNGNLVSSVTFTREGLMIDNIVDIRADRLILIGGQVIFQNNAGINFDNRREDRRQDRRNP